MKYALFTLVLGYLAVWQFDNFRVYILPAVVVFWLLLAANITRKRLEAFPSISDKLKALLMVVLVSVGVALLVALALAQSWLSVWYLPPILAAMVLGRGVLRWLLNQTVSEPKSFGISSETDRGEIVRSKSEKKVADWLHANGYDYEYERKITLPDGATILSDFYLPETEIYIEYWGMATANNEAGERYRARKAEKKELYGQHNYRLMDVYPHHLYELDTYIPEQIKALTQGRKGFFSWLIGLFGGGKPGMQKPTGEVSSAVDDQETVSNALFCTNCGNKVANIGDFCVKCGTQMTEE